MAIDPILDKQKMDMYFKSDLQANNLLAVFATVKNTAAANAYIVTKDDFKLSSQTDDADYASSRAKVGDNTKAMELASIGAVVMAPILIPISATMISDAGTTRHNFLSKEMKTSTTLFPGQSTSGFLYFSLPKNRTNQNNQVLQAVIKDLKSGDTITFDFSIGLKGY